MTKLIPDNRCESCNGLLVPPAITDWASIHASADYVCLQCARPYNWRGQPPRLVTLSLLSKSAGVDESHIE